MIGQAGSLQPGGLAHRPRRFMWLYKSAWRPWLSVVAGLAILAVPFNRGGIWDPYELRIAELARRLATQLFGAAPLPWEPVSSGVVTLEQLGQGELGITSPALGFALFGVSDWAGRATSLFWGTVALLSLWYVVGRLSERGVQAIATLVLASTPLFAWQSRSMLGDAATIGTSTLTTAALLLLSSRCAEAGWGQRLIQLVLATIGLSGGVLCRGVLTGIAVPTLAVGAACLCCRCASTEPARTFERRLGYGLVIVGTVATFWGVREFLLARPGYSPWLGVTLGAFVNAQPFDATLADFLHQMFPLSAFLPWAIASVGRASALARLRRGERLAMLAFAFTIVLSLVSANLLALRAVRTPFSSIAAAAGLFAIGVGNSSRSGRMAVIGATTAIVTSILLFADFVNLPVKILLTTGVHVDRIAESAQGEGRGWLRLSLAFVCGGGIVGIFAATGRAFRKGQTRLRFWLPLDRLRTAFGGQLLSALVLAETALGTIALLQRAHEEAWISVPAFDAVQALAGPLLLWLWVLPPVVLFAVPAAYAGLRSVSEWACSLRRGRGASGLAAGSGLILAGLSLTFGYAPQLAERLSPKRVAAQFSQHAKTGERFALLGLRPESLRYYLGFAPRVFSDVDEAVHWLASSGSQRRWLGFDESMFAEANAAFRASAGTNLVLLDPPTSSVLLVTDRLHPAEVDKNPLSEDVLRDVPVVAHESDSEFGGALRLVGWNLRSNGVSVNRLKRAAAYELALVFRAEGTTSFDWEIFVHLDGLGRRHNEDHDPVNGHYPTSLWQPGDVIVDRHELRLDRTSAPGAYTLYVGLFRGTRRLEVTKGEHNDNRVALGRIEVE